MAVDREDIFEALFTRLETHAATSAVLHTFSRRLESWDDTPPTKQPALMLLMGGSRPRYGDHRNMPPIWTLDAYLLIYVKDDGSHSGVIDPRMNEILTALESALEMQPGEVAASTRPQFPTIGPAPAPTTLGGLCTFCRFSEAGIEVYQGTVGHQGYMRIPLEIEVPGA